MGWQDKPLNLTVFVVFRPLVTPYTTGEHAGSWQRYLYLTVSRGILTTWQAWSYVLDKLKGSKLSKGWLHTGALPRPWPCRQCSVHSLCYATVCLFMMICVWDLWILCVHVWRIRAPFWVLLHSTALYMDGLVHQLVVISNIVHNDMPAPWRTCCFVDQCVMSLRHASAKA